MSPFYTKQRANGVKQYVDDGVLPTVISEHFRADIIKISRSLRSSHKVYIACFHSKASVG